MCVSYITIHTDNQQYEQLFSGQTVQPVRAVVRAIMLSVLRVVMSGARMLLVGHRRCNKKKN